MESNVIKVAMVSNNGRSLNGSFGSAKYFEVITVENNEVTGRETRETYNYEAAQEVPDILVKSENNGMKSFSLNVVDKSKEKHMKIAKSISDCDYVVARGMCANAYDSILQFKMKPVLTTLKEFDDVVKEIIEGTIVNHTERIH